MRLSVILIFICLPGFGQDQWKNIYSYHAWDARDKWQKADELMKLLKIDEGSHVGDVGCHEGYMTFKPAAVVGNSGKVYAVDVDQSKLAKLKNHITERKVKHIEVIKGDYD